MGQLGAWTADVVLSDVRVPMAAVVGGDAGVGRGYQTAMGCLAHGRIHIAALCVGMAERLVDESVSYAQQRTQGGKPIAGFQLIQGLVADSQTDYLAGRSLVLAVADDFDHDRNVKVGPSCAKYFASEMVGRVADRAVQIHGGARLHARRAGGAHVPRRATVPDLRGHQPDPTGHHRPGAARERGDGMSDDGSGEAVSDPTVVIGGGTMGIGIVEVLLDAGADGHAGRADGSGRASASRNDSATAPASPSWTRSSAPVEPVLVVEAVPEDLALKRRLLPAIEQFVPAECVIASNTSSLSIDAIATALARPERFIGMHFFNPVPKSLLVELVVGKATDPGTTEIAADWVQRLGKEHIVVRDSPGFATSRLGLAIGLEAMRMVEDGVASAEDIDRGMVLGYKFPTGPLKLTDLVGLDVRLAIAEHLARELGPRFEPPEILRREGRRRRARQEVGQGVLRVVVITGTRAVR